ncbi:FxSxx-COOH system tetratricopeptide repeat protein [Actinoplanes sp. NPDC051513]|uniref:FxSxx-COOH system tetratricopeptide repeat protein n=1 Tax=Actinoplanes sp. NPDC051513 TaxID=3363908 RepID=UPI0037BADFEB
MVLCQVLAGLGGVGKTQLAAALAHRLWDNGHVDLIVWITATSRTAILTGYADAAARITGIDDAEPDQAAARFLGWLNEPHQRRWLIVLDNLDDPNDLTGLWPPTTTGGHTVVTTRRRDTALLSGRHLIDVDVFTPDQAVAYLHNKLKQQPQRLEEAADLAADLGHLPLALSQAAAYILDRGPRMTCARYRTLLADQRRRLADLAPDALPDQHRDIVAATWTLSIQRADQLAPAGLARPVLELAALLDPNGIPAEIFTTDAAATYCAQRLDRPVDPDDLDDALHILHRFSLLTVDEPTTTARIHAVLQRAVRDNTNPGHQSALAATAADALLEVWPPVERDVAHAQALRANTTALNANIPLGTSNGIHPVLFGATDSLGKVGLVSTAVIACEQLLNDILPVLGRDHPDTLTARSNLARWRGEAGDPAGAVLAYEELLDDVLRVLGPDHPTSLATRNNLASWRGAAGDPAGAVTDYEQLLEDWLRIWGPDHPATLTIYNNLATWQGEAGDPPRATLILLALLDDSLRVLGSDHPDTLTTRHNLALWMAESGDLAGAVTEYEQLLEDRLRVLGPDHPLTLTTRANLAQRRGEAGNPAGAGLAFVDLLEDTLRVLGPDHPLTLSVRANLARLRGEIGDPAGAVLAFEQLLDDVLRVLGPDHPTSLVTRNSLASWRRAAGDPAGALTDYEQLLEDWLRILGPDHPYTLTTRANLAHCRGEAGDPVGAVTAHEQILNDIVRVLGPDHRDTQTFQSNLTLWRGRADNDDSR